MISQKMLDLLQELARRETEHCIFLGTPEGKQYIADRKAARRAAHEADIADRRARAAKRKADPRTTSERFPAPAPSSINDVLARAAAMLGTDPKGSK
ncbi:MAG: hypothetical protein DRQ48_00265 [Gammaproteobacteria bacterium]|nr:MAG: hypothetical protein DRQ48_00265 [Gammaproteobacteria bacterium]